MSYSFLVYLVKMEYVSKSTIFGLKMMLKSGLKNYILKLLHVVNYFPLLMPYFIKGKIFISNYKFRNKNNILPIWRNFKIKKFSTTFTIIFRPTFLKNLIHIPF